MCKCTQVFYLHERAPQVHGRYIDHLHINLMGNAIDLDEMKCVGSQIRTDTFHVETRNPISYDRFTLTAMRSMFH